MGENVVDPPMTLRDRCYPTMAAQPSCIVMPIITGRDFELKAQYMSMLPKFTSREDPYLFLREFEEICSLMQY